MIRSDAYLIEDLFSPDVPQKPTRDGYGMGVLEAAAKNTNVVVMRC